MQASLIQSRIEKNWPEMSHKQQDDRAAAQKLVDIETGEYEAMCKADTANNMTPVKSLRRKAPAESEDDIQSSNARKRQQLLDGDFAVSLTEREYQASSKTVGEAATRHKIARLYMQAKTKHDDEAIKHELYQENSRLRNDNVRLVSKLEEAKNAARSAALHHKSELDRALCMAQKMARNLVEKEIKEEVESIFEAQRCNAQEKTLSLQRHAAQQLAVKQRVAARLRKKVLQVKNKLRTSQRQAARKECGLRTDASQPGGSLGDDRMAVDSDLPSALPSYTPHHVQKDAELMEPPATPTMPAPTSDSPLTQRDIAMSDSDAPSEPVTHDREVDNANTQSQPQWRKTITPSTPNSQGDSTVSDTPSAPTANRQTLGFAIVKPRFTAPSKATSSKSKPVVKKPSTPVLSTQLPNVAASISMLPKTRSDPTGGFPSVTNASATALASIASSASRYVPLPTAPPGSDLFNKQATSVSGSTTPSDSQLANNGSPNNQLLSGGRFSANVLSGQSSTSSPNAPQATAGIWLTGTTTLTSSTAPPAPADATGLSAGSMPPQGSVVVLATLQQGKKPGTFGLQQPVPCGPPRPRSSPGSGKSPTPFQPSKTPGSFGLRSSASPSPRQRTSPQGSRAIPSDDGYRSM